MAPLSRMAGTFSYFLHSIPTLLVSFLALQSTGFASALEKPPVRDRYSSINPFKSEDTTAIWTNEIGQHTLDPDYPEESYRSYADAYFNDLETISNKINNGIKKDRSVKDSFSLSSTRYVPQKLELRKAFRGRQTGYESYRQSTIEANPSLHRVYKNALNIIQSWHPQSDVEIVRMDKSDRTNRNAFVLHVDGFDNNPDWLFTVLTIPASELPLEVMSHWITKNGDRVFVQSLHEESAKVVKVFSNTSETIPKEELIRPLCVSKKTTHFVPGLIKDGPTPKNREINWWHASQLNPFLVTSSSEASLLIPSSYLIHRAPSNEPQTPISNCEYLMRETLAFTYELSPRIQNDQVLSTLLFSRDPKQYIKANSMASYLDKFCEFTIKIIGVLCLVSFISNYIFSTIENTTRN